MMKKYRATKMANGGKTPVKPQAKPPVKTTPQKSGLYKDATGTYTLTAQGAKSYIVEQPQRKPAPAAKATAPKSNNTPKEVFMTDGEKIGAALKRGDYKGVAARFGEAITGAPKELYRAFTKNMESGGKIKSTTKSYKGPKGRK